ncbi:hypothetical protein SAMN05421820_103726 [Pedobacter steynii]|uniref:Uncharacterized protein n=2 Tax=Pedobacter steynii TaxID=430522 RepID=A0A1G9SW86_9SPHI|nr:hypothetical protein SAMN05421820_103726 [Pedobacter steynii]
MKKTILYLLIGCSLASCAQEKKKMNDNLIPDLYKEVKFKDQKISYRAGIQVGASNFVLLINDVPVAQNFEEAGGTFNTSAPINDMILKSGKQHFKLILYPGFKNNVPLTALSENVLAKITIEGLKYEGEGVKTIVEPFTILEIGENGKAFTEKGKPTAIYEGTFDAKVPYDLTAWSKSKDLRKEDSATLEKEVLAFYQQYINIVKNKDAGALAKLVYKKEKNYAQALFLDQEGTQNQWDSYLELIKDPTLVMEPVEKYKMNFYANGRLVTLERIDYPNIGEPALRSESKEDGRAVVGFYFCQLHKPEGSNTLELIH